MLTTMATPVIYSPLKSKAAKSLGATHIQYRISSYQNYEVLNATLVNYISEDCIATVWGLEVSVEIPFPPSNRFHGWFKDLVVHLHPEFTASYERFLRTSNEEFPEAEEKFTEYFQYLLRFLHKYYLTRDRINYPL